MYFEGGDSVLRFKRFKLLAYLNYTLQTPRRNAEPSDFS